MGALFFRFHKHWHGEKSTDTEAATGHSGHHNISGRVDPERVHIQRAITISRTSRVLRVIVIIHIVGPQITCQNNGK